MKKALCMITILLFFGISFPVCATETSIGANTVIFFPQPEDALPIKEVEATIVEIEEPPFEFDWDLQELVLLVHAEAGNQDLTGKRLVADVVFNRVRDPRFPNTIHEVINQKNQFSTSKTLSKWKEHLTESDWDAVMLATVEPINTKVIYFDSLGGVNGKNHFKHGGHWFGE